MSEIEKAGVEVWAFNDGKRITLKDADSRLLSYIKSEIDAREREKTSPLVRSRGQQRHQQGFVVGGTATATCAPAAAAPRTASGSAATHRCGRSTRPRPPSSAASSR